MDDLGWIGFGWVGLLMARYEMEEVKPSKRKRAQPAKQVKKTSSSATTVKRKEKSISQSPPSVETEITPEQNKEVLKQCSNLLSRLMVGH